ncbi:MAG: hypothetical protein J6J64_03105 [Alistipes sp.]|nr:hypothetical protein [Alistipes sp.]
MKLRNLFYLLLALPLAFAACTEDETDPTPVVKDPVLTLTSDAILDFSAEGGAGEISYTLENAKEGVTLTAECAAEWVMDLTAGDKVTFTVAANDAEEARDAKITVKYDTESFEVAVMQAAKQAEPEPEPVAFEAKELYGEYYGDEDGDGVDNYFFALTDTGFDPENIFLPNATYYTVDLYVAGYTGEYSETMAIPVGEYELSENTEAGAFSKSLSYYLVTNEDVEPAAAAYEAGKLTVTETGMTLTVTIQGVEHTVTYAGECVVDNATEAPVVGNEIKVQYAYATYYGDQYTPGTADNFYFFLSDDGLDADGWEVANGKYYRFDLYTELVDKANGVAIPYGTYTWDATDSYAPGTISAYYSEYYVLDEYGWDFVEVRKPTNATITVDANGVVAEVWFGEELTKVVFEGVVAVTDASSGDDGGDDEDEIYSTIDGDLSLNIEGATFVVEDYGDYYYNGTNNYVVYVYEDAENYTGAYLMFDLLAAGTNIAGEYACSNDESAYTFFKGYFDSYWEEYYGSWYWDFNTGNCAPFVDGTITIDVDANGKHTLTLNCVDDAGNAITGTIREAGNEGGNEGGDGGETNANHYEIAEFVWSWIDSDSGCGDIIFKTALDENDDYKAFKLSFNGIPSSNVLPDGEYSSEDGSMNASWCYHLLWDNANGCAMASVSATVATDASGVTTINASWIPNNGSNETHSLTWVGEMPIYGADW